MNRKRLNIPNTGSRNHIRTQVVKTFLKEQPGTGKGSNASKYQYVVAILNSGNYVVLQRSANLKNGFDFLIKVEGIDFSKGQGRYRDYPKHDDIIIDLQNKKNENSDKYKTLYNEIEKIYNCQEPDNTVIQKLVFKNGYPLDLLIQVIKWFFIEQDIRYWNYSGRNMLMSSIPKP